MAKENTLHLTLRKKWFDMILSGEKKEEYREIKPYWVKRFLSFNMPEESKGENWKIPDDFVFDIKSGHKYTEVMKAYYSTFQKFDTIRFTNGYSKTAPTFDIECLGISIGKGKSEWGASTVFDPFSTEIEDTFIISLGKIISSKNITP